MLQPLYSTQFNVAELAIETLFYSFLIFLVKIEEIFDCTDSFEYSLIYKNLNYFCIFELY